MLIANYLLICATAMPANLGLTIAVAAVESAHNPSAVSPKGAVGLMQMTAIAHTELRLARDVPEECRPALPWSHSLHKWAAYSEWYGTCYLELMWRRHGNLEDTLIAYNAGSSRVTRYRLERRLPLETWVYLQRVGVRLYAQP